MGKKEPEKRGQEKGTRRKGTGKRGQATFSAEKVACPLFPWEEAHS